jgi:hypothetical protein
MLISDATLKELLQTRNAAPKGGPVGSGFTRPVALDDPAVDAATKEKILDAYTAAIYGTPSGTWDATDRQAIQEQISAICKREGIGN